MKNQKIPQLYLEQLLVGELPAAKAREISGRQEVDSMLSELAASNEEILEQYPPSEIVGLIEERQAKQTRSATTVSRFPIAVPRSVALLAAALIIATAGVLPFVLRHTESVSPGTELTRVKGLEPQIIIYRKNGGAIEKLSSNATARDGDLVQLGYNAAGQKYGAIFSIDGRGVVTLHFPYPRLSDTSPRLERNGEVVLNYSYKLDDAPGFERFFFVAAETPFSLKTILGAASQLAASGQARRGELRLPKGFTQTSELLVKEAVR